MNLNKYYAILTDVGLSKLNAAQRTNNKVQLTHMLFGDGNGTPYSPTGHETSLKREVWRTTISEFGDQSANLVSIEAIIPAEVGGWTIREAGVIDSEGDLIAIANYQDTPKPILNSNGTTLDLTIKLLIEVNNSNNVTVTIDPNVANASRKFVEQTIEPITQQLAQKAEKNEVTQLVATKADRNEINTLASAKADRTYVDALITNVADGSPRDVFYSITALQTAFPTGQIGTYLVFDSSFTDGAHSFIWKTNAWVDLGVYQANAIAENSVKPLDTTFVKAGKNKFDGNYVSGVSITGNNTSGGSLIKSSDANAKCAIIKVEEGKNYVVSRGAGGNRFRVALSVGKPSIGTVFSRVLYFVDSRTEYTLTTQNGENYIVVYVTSDGTSIPEWLQVEEGTTKTAYTPQKIVMDLEDESLDTSVVKGLRVRAVLTSEATSFNIDLNNQQIIVNQAYLTIGAKSYDIAADTYSYASVTDQTVVVLFNEINRTLGLYSPTESVNPASKNKPLVGLIQKNSGAVDFNGAYQINGQTVLPYTGIEQDTPKELPQFVLTDNVAGNYESTSSYINADGAITIEEVYTIYDNLVTNYPDYVKKTLAYNVGGLPAYRYDFTPPKPYRYPNYQLPKIYYQSGIHGHEKRAAMGGAAFFKELCELWKSSDLLSMLRWNFAFTVIPVVNPTGFNLNQRKNANGVDLNRNFPNGWTLETDTSSTNYGGTAPLSEVESQYVDNVLRTEKDILFVIDQHNSGYYSTENFIMWLGSNNTKTRLLNSGVANQMTHYLKRNEFGNIDASNANLVYISGASDGTFIKHCESYNIPCTLLEASLGWGSTYSNVQNVTTTGLANLILAVVRNYELLR